MSALPPNVLQNYFAAERAISIQDCKREHCSSLHFLEFNIARFGRKEFCNTFPPKADICIALADVCFVPIADISQRHSMRKGPPFGIPSNALIFFFRCGWCLLIAPVLTSITPIRASNAHGRGWIYQRGPRHPLR